MNSTLGTERSCQAGNTEAVPVQSVGKIRQHTLNIKKGRCAGQEAEPERSERERHHHEGESIPLLSSKKPRLQNKDAQERIGHGTSGTYAQQPTSGEDKDPHLNGSESCKACASGTD